MSRTPKKTSKTRKIDLLFEAVTFAEGGEIDAARRLASEIFPEKRPPAHTTAGNVTEETGIFEAVAYAEAGLQEEAFGTRRLRGQEGRLLVVGGTEGFSNKLIENAVGLAQRMNLGIAAVSIFPAANRFKALFIEPANPDESPSVADFRKRAEASDLPFSHMAVADEPGRALATARKVFRRINLLMTEPQTLPEDRVRSTGLPVFYLADA